MEVWPRPDGSLWLSSHAPCSFPQQIAVFFPFGAACVWSAA